MKALITGSSGQIGTNLGLALLARGDLVLGLDKRPNTWTENISTTLLDLTALPSPAACRQIAAFSPDIIVHLAAWAKVHQLVKEPEKALENITMTFQALELARQAKIPIVLGSSREVYGDVVRHLTDESMADFVVAESPYSASKIAGEALFSSYAKCYGLRTLVFRFSNVYGRYDNDLARMERVIPLFVKKIAAGEPITVFGKEKMLDFTWIDDCVSGIIGGLDRLIASRGPASGAPGAAPIMPHAIANQTINLAYGEGQTLQTLVALIESALGKKAQATYAASQTGEVTRYVADITKARKLLEYSPTTPLARGIVEYVKWCRQSHFLPA